MKVVAKLKALRAAKALNSGHLLGHQTSTVAGMAASAQSAKGVLALQRFKQRKAPFLLLADSSRTAFQQAIWLPAALRTLLRTSWPGSVTLVFSAVQSLPNMCYQRRKLAVRVDDDALSRCLAKACGGLLLSSSFNRKGKAVAALNTRTRYRWQRHLGGVVQAPSVTSGVASSIFRLSAGKVQQLR